MFQYVFGFFIAFNLYSINNMHNCKVNENHYQLEIYEKHIYIKKLKKPNNSVT